MNLAILMSCIVLLASGDPPPAQPAPDSTAPAAQPPADAPPSPEGLVTPPGPIELGPGAPSATLTAEKSEAAAPREERVKLLGVMLNAGFPNGATLTMTARPFYFVRFHGGFAWNYLGFGIQGGVTLLPFRFVITPTLTLEGGHFFASDVRSKITGVPQDVRPMLESFGYDYLSAQIGFELGGWNGVVFFTRFGLGQFYTTVHGAGSTVNAQSGGSPTSIELGDIRVRAVVPALNLGLVVNVW